MSKLVDIVIVGAGVIGASCAAQLAKAGHRVVVVDAASRSASGSTGRSFGGVRAQWADEMNVTLAWESIQRLQAFPTEHGIDVGYRPLGYMMLVDEPGWERQLAAVQIQRSHGVPVELLDVGQARAITPFAADGIVGATWCATDGVADPLLLTDAYLGLAQASGAEILFDHPVTAIETGPAGQWRVRAGAADITGQHVVNAAGGWAGELAAMAGLSVPVEHSRRSMYAASAAGFPSTIPTTFDLSSGVFARTRGDHVVFTLSPPDPETGCFTEPDWAWFDVVYPMAIARFPWLAALPLDRDASWGGTYEVTPDFQAILGPDPGAPTWINACGFSGHGLMQAPMIGELIAEQVGQGDITSVDVTALRIDRFAAGAGLRRAALVL